MLRTTHGGTRSSLAFRGSVAPALALLLAVASVASADARTDYLVRTLRTSTMFRVRTQAAISLGGVETEPAVVEALAEALSDDHPTVRAAAAAALQQHGDPSALSALRRAMGDSEAVVRRAAERTVRHLERVARSRPRSRRLPDPSPSADARFYVAVGRPGSSIRGLSRDVLEGAQQLIEQTVRSYDGVEIAPERESRRAARRVLDERNLVGFYLDSSIVALEERPGGGLRARVSIVLQSYPERNIRSMLNGAATVMGASGSEAQEQAIQGALRGALRNLPQALEAGAASAQASAPRRRHR